MHVNLLDDKGADFGLVVLKVDVVDSRSMVPAPRVHHVNRYALSVSERLSWQGDLHGNFANESVGAGGEERVCRVDAMENPHPLVSHKGGGSEMTPPSPSPSPSPSGEGLCLCLYPTPI